jgi:hypothetical protein
MKSELLPEPIARLECYVEMICMNWMGRSKQDA